MKDIIQFIYSNFSLKDNFETFNNAIICSFKDTLSKEKKVYINLDDMGIYETVARLMYSLVAYYPDNWREMICDKLDKIFPDKKDEIEKLKFEDIEEATRTKDDTLEIVKQDMISDISDKEEDIELKPPYKDSPFPEINPKENFSEIQRKVNNFSDVFKINMYLEKKIPTIQIWNIEAIKEANESEYLKDWIYRFKFDITPTNSVDSKIGGINILKKYRDGKLNYWRFDLLNRIVDYVRREKLSILKDNEYTAEKIFVTKMPDKFNQQFQRLIEKNVQKKLTKRQKEKYKNKPHYYPLFNIIEANCVELNVNGDFIWPPFNKN